MYGVRREMVTPATQIPAIMLNTRTTRRHTLLKIPDTVGAPADHQVRRGVQGTPWRPGTSTDTQQYPGHGRKGDEARAHRSREKGGAERERAR